MRGMNHLNPDLYFRAFSASVLSSSRAPNEETAPNQEIHKIAISTPNGHPESSSAIRPQQIFQHGRTPLSVTESARSADVVSAESEDVQNESVEIVELPVAPQNGDDTSNRTVEVQEVAGVLPNFPAFRYNPGNEHQGHA